MPRWGRVCRCWTTSWASSRATQGSTSRSRWRPEARRPRSRRPARRSENRSRARFVSPVRRVTASGPRRRRKASHRLRSTSPSDLRSFRTSTCRASTWPGWRATSSPGSWTGSPPPAGSFCTCGSLTARTSATCSTRSSRRSAWPSGRPAGREGGRPDREGTGAVPGRAVLPGDRLGGTRLRVGPALAQAGSRRDRGRDDPGADRAGVREPRRDSRGGRLELGQAREDDGVPGRPERLPGHERGLRAARRRAPPGAGDGRDFRAAVRREGGDRSDRRALRDNLRMEISLGADLEEAIEAEASSVEGVYLVGGTVRDLILERANWDVDIAVVGDAIAFADGLAEKLGGRSQPHGQFGTAVVTYGERLHVDVVTAR